MVSQKTKEEKKQKAMHEDRGRLELYSKKHTENQKPDRNKTFLKLIYIVLSCMLSHTEKHDKSFQKYILDNYPLLPMFI